VRLNRATVGMAPIVATGHRPSPVSEATIRLFTGSSQAGGAASASNVGK
jgi:hypothetical protein